MSKYSNTNQLKLDEIIRSKFRSIYGDKASLSTSERKEWGSFLVDRGISWEIKVSKKVNWHGWEFSEEGKFVHPKGLKNHIKVNHYFVPQELALKMLVLGELI